MPRISWRELRSMLEKLDGEHRVEIGYYSEARLRKKNPFTKVMKMAVYNGTIGKTHRAAEKEAVEKLGTGHEFAPVQGRKWGHRVGESPVIKHEDKFYIEMTEVNETSVVYNADGVGCTEEQIAEWLYPKQEIVPLRDFDLTKVRSFKLDDLPIVEVV